MEVLRKKRKMVLIDNQLHRILATCVLSKKSTAIMDKIRDRFLSLRPQKSVIIDFESFGEVAHPDSYREVRE